MRRQCCIIGNNKEGTTVVKGGDNIPGCGGDLDLGGDLDFPFFASIVAEPMTTTMMYYIMTKESCEGWVEVKESR